MQTSFYPEKIMAYLNNPPNIGRLIPDNQTIFKAEIGSLDKYLKIELYLEIDNAIINQVRYLVYGDGPIIASLGKLSEDLPGMKISQALNYSMSDLADNLDIPAAYRNKLKLIKQAIDNIISQYKAKKI